MSSIASTLRKRSFHAIKYVPYRQQKNKLAVGTMVESLHTQESQYSAAILVFKKTVTLMGQREASYNLL